MKSIFFALALTIGNFCFAAGGLAPVRLSGNNWINVEDNIYGFLENYNTSATTPSVTITVASGNRALLTCSFEGTMTATGITPCFKLTKGGNVIHYACSQLNPASSSQHVGGSSPALTLPAGTYVWSAVVNFAASSGNAACFGYQWYIQ